MIDTRLSPQDLTAIASDVGLSVDEVRSAIGERDPVPEGSWFLGAPTVALLEATRPREDDASKIDTFLWRAKSIGFTRVAVTPTHVRVTARFAHLAGALFGGIGGGAGGGIGGPLFALTLVKTGSLALATLAFLSTAVLSLATARAIFRAIVRARLGTLRELLDTLTISSCEPPD